MYNGTLILDLMATVEQVEQAARCRRMAEEMELQRMFELQVPDLGVEQFFAGAA
jgi:hypothetical protein